MADIITSCNEALSKIAKGLITALTESSVEAKYCNLLQQPLVDEMADWCSWPQLIKRQTLVAVTNDRPAEWVYAYAKPSDYGEPIAIRKVEDDLTTAPLVETPYTLPQQDKYPLGFIVEGGKVYTNVETAALVYSSSTLTFADFTPMMRRAFVDELAARLAAPVAKLSMGRVDVLKREAMVSKLDAISHAENKNPRQEVKFTSMSEFAREGYLE